MRLPVLSVSILAGCMPVSAETEPPEAVSLGEAPPPLAPRAWAPPEWFPDETLGRLWVLEELDGDPVVDRKSGPRSIRSSSAVVADLDRGTILWAKDPDSPRSIASVTKLFSSLAVASLDTDLDREVCISLEQWPTRPGARSKFETGDCVTGWELLGDALVASDNRGAFSMPAMAEVDYYQFVHQMRSVAVDIGAEHAGFVDPAGLEDENMASARDVLKAVVAVAEHPTLSILASAPLWQIDTDRGPRELMSTNRVLALSQLPAKTIKRGRKQISFVPPPFETLAAKTGYTDTAHYCFAIVVQSQRTGRRLAAAVLNAPTSSARFDDVLAMLEFADAWQPPPAGEPTEP